LPERACECLVRSVSGGERDVEDVGRAIGERRGGVRQAARSRIGRHRLTRRTRKRAAQVEGGDADGRRDAIEGKILAEVTLDEPQRLAGHGRWHHGTSIEPSASLGLMVLALGVPAQLIAPCARDCARRRGPGSLQWVMQ
jgi:hypothetical protein